MATGSFKTTQYKPDDGIMMTTETVAKIQDMMRGWISTVMATKRMAIGNKEKIIQYYTGLITYIVQSRSTIAVIETVDGGDEPAAVYIKLALGSKILPNPYMRFGCDKFRNLMCDLSYALLPQSIVFWPTGTNARRVTMDKFDNADPVWVSRFVQGLEWMIEVNPFAVDAPQRITTNTSWLKNSSIDKNTGLELVKILVQSRVYVPIVRLWLVLIEKMASGNCVLPHPMILMQSRTKHGLLVFTEKAQAESVRQALRSPWVLADRPHKQRSIIGQIGRKSQLLATTGGASTPSIIDDDAMSPPSTTTEGWVAS